MDNMTIRVMRVLSRTMEAGGFVSGVETPPRVPFFTAEDALVTSTAARTAHPSQVTVVREIEACVVGAISVCGTLILLGGAPLQALPGATAHMKMRNISYNFLVVSAPTLIVRL